MLETEKLPLADTTWQGYLRQDGRKGIRNLILVIYTVECASFVAHAVAAGEEDVHVIGFSGCYDNAYAIRLMLALATHPNVGGCLAIGLGCEYTQPAKLAELAEQSGRPSDWFYIQNEGGTRSACANASMQRHRECRWDGAIWSWVPNAAVRMAPPALQETQWWAVSTTFWWTMEAAQSLKK
jgi:altronate dehydratase